MLASDALLECVDLKGNGLKCCGQSLLDSNSIYCSKKSKEHTDNPEPYASLLCLSSSDSDFSLAECHSEKPEEPDESHGYIGLDLTGNDVCGIMHDFESSTPNTRLFTPCKCEQSFFVVKSNEELHHVCISHRIALDISDPVTFIESTQLCGFPQHCNEIFIANCEASGMKWYLGIIEILSVMHPQILVLHKWKGFLHKSGVPKFMDKSVSCWDDVASNFFKVQVHPDDIEVKFLNLIRSSSLNSTPKVLLTTRNTKDNVQCSVFGPDVFVVPPPIQFRRLGSSLISLKKMNISSQHVLKMFMPTSIM